MTFSPFIRTLLHVSHALEADVLEKGPPSVVATGGRLLALQVRTTGHPLDPDNVGTIIKPAELVDVVEITPLNRSELILYNQLLAHAWNDMAPGKVYKLPKSLLRTSHDSNDRLHEAFDRLMGAFAKVRYRDPNTGRPMTTRISLLGPNTEEDADQGAFYYTIHDSLFRVLENSVAWARLKSEVMYLLRSKYSLRLYEMVERRINLSSQSETFSVTEFRSVLGVPDNKLPRFSDFNKHALRPALAEINQLTDYEVSVAAIMRGRTVDKLMLTWFKKGPAASKLAAEERHRSRVGRVPRRQGRVVQVVG